MRSTDVLSHIGQDLGKLLMNNDTTLEVLRDPKVKPKSKEWNKSEITLREDLHDVLVTDRELVKFLHLAIKDFEITQAQLKDVETLIEPDLGGTETISDQFPEPHKADEYFSAKAKEREDLLDKFPFLRNRMKGDLNG